MKCDGAQLEQYEQRLCDRLVGETKDLRSQEVKNRGVIYNIEDDADAVRLQGAHRKSIVLHRSSVMSLSIHKYSALLFKAVDYL